MIFDERRHFLKKVDDGCEWTYEKLMVDGNRMGCDGLIPPAHEQTLHPSPEACDVYTGSLSHLFNDGGGIFCYGLDGS